MTELTQGELLLADLMSSHAARSPRESEAVVEILRLRKENEDLRKRLAELEGEKESGKSRTRAKRVEVTE